jgi:hypothetical protein
MIILPSLEFYFSDAPQTTQTWENGSPGTGRGKLDASVGLRNFFYVENLRGSAQYKFSSTGSLWELWNDLVRDEGYTSLAIRWGFMTEKESIWSDWRSVICNNTHFSFASGTFNVLIEGTDVAFTLKEICGKRYFSDKLVSDMVKEIAESHKLEYRITETVGKFTRYQTTESDAEFISNELIPLAISGGNRADYLFYIEDGVRLVFEPPRLDEDAIYNFRFAPTGGRTDPSAPAEILKMDLFCRRGMLTERDALSTEVRGFDAMGKEPVTWIADDDSVGFIKLAPFPLARIWTKPGNIMLSPLPEAIDYDRTQVETEAVEEWSRNYRSLFRLRLETMPLPLARVGRVVEIDVKDTENKDHFMSGRYLVYACEQKMVQPSPTGAMKYTTVLYLERRTRR